MVIIYYSINKVLFGHLEKIFPDQYLLAYGSKRDNNFDYFKDIFKVSFHSQRHLFIYNTSPANLFVSVISKLLGSKITFHIHDPKPHSGILNPVIYLIQLFQLLFSDNIIVFDPLLIRTTFSYYPFISKKKLKVFPHGKPEFNSVKVNLNNNKVNFGFFGRNMPYKNVDKFLSLSTKFSEGIFNIYGKGYCGIFKLNQNVNVIDKFIDNDLYYSYMVAVDYIVLPYRDISFSGIVNDAISLGKKMIVSKYIMNKYTHPLMILLSKFDNPIKQKKPNINNGGWQAYAKNLKKL